MLVNLPDNSSSVESLNMKEWQDGLRALLPNININFGGLPNASSPSNANHSVPTSNTATTDSLNWDSPGSWMDPAIITGNRFSLLQLHWQTIKWVFGTNWFTSGKKKKSVCGGLFQLPSTEPQGSRNFCGIARYNKVSLRPLQCMPGTFAGSQVDQRLSVGPIYRVNVGVPSAGWHVRYVRRWSWGTEGIHWTLLFKKGRTPLVYKALFYKAVWLCFLVREAEAWFK